MRTRPFKVSDAARVREIYQQQDFDYNEPDWSKMDGMVLVDDQDVVRLALLDRPTVENYALIDKSNWAAPGTKAVEFARLDAAETKYLRARGYQDQHCWVPPMCRSFIRRMMKHFGWVESAGQEKWLGLTRRVL